MAAYAALASLMQTIDDIQTHPSPPIPLDSKQVESLTQIVGFLQEFLEDYVSADDDGDEADPLEMRIADAAYAVQDVIESHIVDKIQANESSLELVEEYVSSDDDEILGFLRELFEHADSDGDDPLKSIANAAYDAEDVVEVDNIPLSSKNPDKKEETNLYEDVEQVMEEMDLIKKELMERQKSGMVIHDDQSHRLVSAPHIPTLGSSSSFSSVGGQNSSGMVCSEDVLLGIMERLVYGELDLQIIPIVGMGGIGKTTLAKTVYSNPLIKDRFDICAWVTISQQYNTREILSEILFQATHQRKEEVSEDEVGEAIHKYLFGRRFLIVMDDMWSYDAWSRVQRYFPNNENSSRVLVTTRLSQLSSQLNNDYNLQMKFLDEVSSWELFTKTVFGEEISCDSELEKIGKEIVSNCRGLPLSIVVAGGILKKVECTKACWESVRMYLTSLVNLDNDKHCLRLLKLSYDHLPIFLKPCFLYMGVFEEDDEIRVSTIVKLWASEGFVKAIKGKSLEESAKEWLKELVERNIILSHRLGKTGNIKYCKIHDLLRDLSLKQGKKEGLYHVVGEDCPRGINSQRRLVLPRNASKWKVRHALLSMPHARSVISLYSKIPKCQNSGLLKTVHAVSNSYSNFLVFLQQFNLRHLAITVDCTSSLFYSIDLLWKLHTLIVSSPHESKAPAELWRLPHIRHIEFDGMSFSLPDPPSSDVVIMENLLTLKGVVDFKFGEEVVERIPNVKKLKIRYWGRKGTNDDDHYNVSNIKCLSKLESLHIHCNRCVGDQVACLQNNLTFPHSLQRLNLEVRFNFEWKWVLEKIGWLPHLQKLTLCGGWLRGGKWEIEEGQFTSLKYLNLQVIRELEELAAAEDCSSIFPCLHHLDLFGLIELKEITTEIGNIPTLRKIDMSYCSELAMKSVKRIVDEQVEMQGDQLPFLVDVFLSPEKMELKSMAGPNFKVS